MNEDRTRELQNNRSFEERVFARFDALDRRFQVLEARSYDTKPIWERALAEIVEVKNGVREIRTDIAELKSDVAVLKTDVALLKTDVAQLKADMAQVKKGLETLDHKFEIISLDLIQLRADQRGLRKRVEDLESSAQ